MSTSYKCFADPLESVYADENRFYNYPLYKTGNICMVGGIRFSLQSDEKWFQIDDRDIEKPLDYEFKISCLVENIGKMTVSVNDKLFNIFFENNILGLCPR